jgi:hypothetical protein
MPDSVRRLAADLYSPFAARETRTLRGYIADVEELVASAFFQSGQQTLTVSCEMGGPLQKHAHLPGCARCDSPPSNAAASADDQAP